MLLDYNSSIRVHEKGAFIMKLKDLDKFYEEFSEYTELRVHENSSTKIAIVDGRVMTNSKTTCGGVNARVYMDGQWGFASSSTISDKDIRKVIAEAKSNAEFLKNKAPNKHFEELKVSDYSFEKSFATTKPRKSQKELIDFGKMVYNHVKDTYTGLLSISVNITCDDTEKQILTSSKAYYYTLTPRSNVLVTLVIDRDGAPIQLSQNFGGLGQFEDKFDKPEDLYEEIGELYKKLLEKKNGVYPEAGLKDVIIDSSIAGLFAHEAIGHTTEADLVLGGSVAGYNLGKQVASPLITLIDFAHTAYGETCPMPIYIDEEGTKGQDVVIIDNGVLKGFMHNKETANMFGVNPTGNARATDYFDEPIIRMRNTCIAPGNQKLEDMIASIEDGYYLVSATNGQADTTSEFMFGISFGYEIKNGKLGRAILDTTISGVAFDVLKSVTAVSDELKWSRGGWCGKKQTIKVGMGGPSIKCKVNIGGK